MAGVGDVHGHEHRQIDGVGEVARTAQTGKENRVVCQQGEQEAIHDAIAEFLLRLPDPRCLRIQQIDRHDHGIGRFHADEHLADAHTERMVEHEIAARDRALHEGLPVTGTIGRDGSVLALEIDSIRSSQAISIDSRFSTGEAVGLSTAKWIQTGLHRFRNPEPGSSRGQTSPPGRRQLHQAG